MSSTVYLVKDVEISTDMDEIDWEDSKELAKEVLSARPLGADYYFVTASNVDWRGSNGVAIFDITDDTYETFWSKIAGWSNADWTLRIAKIGTKPRKFEAVAYSHDTPTGGGRIIRFLTGRAVAEWLLLDGTDERKKDVFAHFGVSTRPELVAMLQGNHMADSVKELL